jgi:hypothetical protein
MEKFGHDCGDATEEVGPTAATETVADFFDDYPGGEIFGVQIRIPGGVYGMDPNFFG